MRHFAAILSVLLLLAAPSFAQTEPRAVVHAFYKSYMQQMEKPGNWLKPLMEKHSADVESQLRDLLVKLSEGEAGGDAPWLDFDPFSNSQMGSEAYVLGQTKMKGSLAYVPVKIKYPRDPGQAQLAANIVLRQTEGRWKIANLAYPARDGMKAWDLLGYLKESFKLK